MVIERAVRPEYRDWRRDESEDVVETIEAVKGPIIEIGGPTVRREYEGWNKRLWLLQMGFIGLPAGRKAYVSNIEMDGNIDFAADGRKLPFTNGSIGAIYASALPHDVRGEVVVEVYRVLEEGGLLVFNHGNFDDFIFCLHLGFGSVQYTWNKSTVCTTFEEEVRWKEIEIFYNLNFVVVKRPLGD